MYCTTSKTTPTTISEQAKMNMSNLFNSSQLSSKGNKNEKFRRTLRCLQWRQLYQNAGEYKLELENGEAMIVKQIMNGEIKGLGTGTMVWPAAHVLLKYMEKRFGYNAQLVGKRVCDIGSGTGITGFVAAILGAHVVQTDQIQLIPFLEENKVLVCGNCSDASLSARISVAKYDWGEDITELCATPFDYVIVSDCVLPKLYPIDILLQGVSAVMGPNTVALFSYEHRPFPYYDPRDEFRRLAAEFNLTVRVIPIEEHHEMFCADDIEIWEVTRLP